MTTVQDTKFEKISSLKIDTKAKVSASNKGKGIFWLLGVIVVVLFLGGVIAFKGNTVAVEIATARQAIGNQAYTVLNASGYVTPRRRATVAAKITGRVRDMLVEEGMNVEKNQVLARLDDADARAAYGAAKAEFKVAESAIPELEINRLDAERTLKRTKSLAEEGIIDQQSLDKAQAAYESFEAKLKLAHDNVSAAKARMKVSGREIENCIVRAPFSGIVVTKDAQVGEIVSPLSAGGGFARTGICTIVDMSSLEIEVDVSESYIAKVTVAQKVEAMLDAYSDWKIPAIVRTVIPTADRQKATVKVRISFVALDPKILPDMGVKVAFLEGAAAEKNAGVKALIPRDAIRQSEGKSFVYVLKNARVERRAVTLGHEGGNDVEILAGVIPGEELVVRGPETLKDGQKVDVKTN